MVKDDAFFGAFSTNVIINVTSVSPLTITGTSSLEASSGASFSHQLTASGGTTPYTWSIVGGSIPQGLILNSTSGVLFGNPATPGNTSFTIQVADAASRTAQKLFTMFVRPPSIQVSTSSLATAVQGSSYAQQLSATGGAPPYTWSISGGALPSGLTLNSSTGVVSGTPGVTGAFNFTAAVTDQFGASAGKSLSVTVVGPESVPGINKVKYKKGARKLIIIGRNFNPNPAVFVDNQRVTIKSFATETIVIKPLPLTPGIHVVRVINTNGISSDLFAWIVN
jgi:hypothetical protein